MATDNKILDLSFPAAEDLSSDQYRFVVLTSTGTIRRPDSETEVCLGILQNAPGSGEAAVVRILGVSMAQVNAALGIGTFVMQEYVSATDAGKAKTSAGAPAYTRAMVMEASETEDELASVLLTTTFPAINDAVASVTTVTTKTTAGAATYSAAELIGGNILRDPNGAARSDVTPTAALIVAGIPGAIISSSFKFSIRNTANANELITLTAGVGVTLNGAMTIPQNMEREFVAVCTNVTGSAEAVTIYDMGARYSYFKDHASFFTVTTEASTAAATYTAAQLLGGYILRDPNGGPISDVTPSAAFIVGAIPNCIPGTGFEFTMKNTANAAETITLTAGAGVTLIGTMTIALNNTKRFLTVADNVGTGTEAVTIYSLGTVVH